MNIARHYIKTLTLAALVLCPIWAGAQTTLGFKGEEAASVGIYIKDIRTGEVLAQNDQLRALMPASVMKSITAATALSTLKPDFCFSTPVYLTGSVSNGVCTGDLVIESCGDPTIDSENFDDRPTLASEIADALSQQGVKTIKGKIVIKESLTDSGCIPEWEIDDVGWAYGAGLYGFNYRDNVFSLWPATKKTQPVVPGLDVTVRQAKGVDLVRGINSDNLIVYGPKPNDKTWRISVAMQRPAGIFAANLETFLADKGIRFNHNGERSDNKRLIMTHHSPTLASILSEMMIYSHNLYAEGMLRALAPGATRKQAVEKQSRIWADRGISMDYNKVLDGSGLSRADRLQPVFIGNILEWMACSDMARTYVSLFPKAGVDGTVKTLLKDSPLKGQLALKSGSMNAVQCFAGYKIDNDGKPTHVVVILVNAFYCDRTSLRTSIERFLEKTFTIVPTQTENK